MAIYAVSPEGVSELNHRADQVGGACGRIRDLCGDIRRQAGDRTQVLGPHAGELEEALAEIETAAARASYEADTIAAALWKIAEGYQRIIDRKLTGGSSSGAAAGASSGASRDGKSSSDRGLSAAERAQLKKETGWSDSIVNSIRSVDEAEIYRKADLQEAVIGGKTCLIRSDLDMEQRSEEGLTNAELIEMGLCPLDPGGKPYELHHVGQKDDSPLAELSFQEHRGRGNDTVMHDKQKESEIDRAAFGRIRSSHWAARLADWLSRRG